MKTRASSYTLFYTYRACLLFLLTPFLQGCPYYSPFKLDASPQNHINESILGSWQGDVVDEMGNHRVVNIRLSKKNDNEYDYFIWGAFQKKEKKKNETQDTIVGSAYISYLANRQFLNISFENKFYIAELKYESDELSILPLDESFSSRIIKSDEQLNKAVLFHYKSRLFPTYDETLSFKYMKRLKEN
jgi:hypothetical protein